MNTQRSNTESVLARAVSAEIRALMAARRISGNMLAAKVGVSQNYLATRLRDEKPFTLDDVAKIIHEIDERQNPHDFIARAYENHSVTIDDEWMLAARDTSDDEESEEQQREP